VQKVENKLEESIQKHKVEVCQKKKKLDTIVAKIERLGK